MSMRPYYCWFFGGCVLWGATAVWAATPEAQISDPSTLLGARSVGQGGNTVGSQVVHDSQLQNPAGGSFAKNYALSFGYLGMGDTLAASIVDSQSGPVGGGVVYVRRDLSRGSSTRFLSAGDYARTEERAGFSLFGKAGAQVGLGASVKYAYRRSFDARYSSGKNWNGDVGALFSVHPQWRVGATFQNLFTDETGLQPKNLQTGIEFSANPHLRLTAQGTKFLLPNFPATWAWGVGGEYAWDMGLTLRTGYKDNLPWNEKFAAIGAGYALKSFSFDYSAQIPIRATESATLHSFGVTGYL